VVKTRKRVLGEEHPSTLRSMNILASTYRNQGRWKKVEKLHVQVMETRKTMLGEEHSGILSSINKLAFTLKSQSRNEEATSLTKRCYKLRNRSLARDIQIQRFHLKLCMSGKMEKMNL